MKKIILLFVFGVFTTLGFSQEKAVTAIAKEQTIALKNLVSLEDDQIEAVYQFFLSEAKAEKKMAGRIAVNDPKAKERAKSKKERKDETMKQLLTEEQYTKYLASQ